MEHVFATMHSIHTSFQPLLNVFHTKCHICISCKIWPMIKHQSAVQQHPRYQDDFATSVWHIVSYYHRECTLPNKTLTANDFQDLLKNVNMYSKNCKFVATEYFSHAKKLVKLTKLIIISCYMWVENYHNMQTWFLRIMMLLAEIIFSNVK